MFDLSQDSGGAGTYEKRIETDLLQPLYQNASLIVADQDLSKSRRYPGLSESAIKRVADGLGIPECAYSRGNQAEDLFRSAEQREARIVLNLTGNDQFPAQVVSLAEGFEEIAEKLRGVPDSTDLKHPGKLLAYILGKLEYADKISLYASGDLNRLATIVAARGKGLERKMSVRKCLMGYWLWDSVLRYPGVVVDEVAAASYLNIKGDIFHSDSQVRVLFNDATYSGPFATAKGPMWWRAKLDDIVANSNVPDGRDHASRILAREIPRSECCEDSSKPAGYYCMLSKKPVSLENSKGGLAWFPRGADLARVSLSKYDEIGPWL